MALVTRPHSVVTLVSYDSLASQSLPNISKLRTAMAEVQAQSPEFTVPNVLRQWEQDKKAWRDKKGTELSSQTITLPTLQRWLARHFHVDIRS